MRRTALFGLGLSFLSGAVCQADAIYNVTLNTAALRGNANAPFALDFQLSNGNTASSVINTVRATNFTFGTGGAAGTGNPFANTGNAGGNLTSTVLLSTQGAPFNEFSQNFSPGSSLSFQLALTTNRQTGPTPDEFSFDLIDKSASSISTTDPSGSGALIILDITGTALTPQVFTTNGDSITITPQLSAVPEPATGWMALAAMGVSVAALRPRRRAVKIDN